MGQLQANCYFLIKGEDCIIVDPADDASFLLEEIQRRRLNLKGLLTTHGHFDHIMAVGEIQLSFDTPLYLGKEDQFLVDRLEETAEYFLGFKPAIIKPTNIKYLEGKKINIGSFAFEVITCPGHTPGGVSYYFPSEKVVFTGDTLFKGSIGRFDFSYCDKRELSQSLVKLSKLPDETRVLSGHGEATTIMEEKNNLQQFLNYLK